MPRFYLASVRDLARSSLTGVAGIIGSGRAVLKVAQPSSAATSGEE